MLPAGARSGPIDAAQEAAGTPIVRETLRIDGGVPGTDTAMVVMRDLHRPAPW